MRTSPSRAYQSMGSTARPGPSSAPPASSGGLHGPDDGACAAIEDLGSSDSDSPAAREIPRRTRLAAVGLIIFFYTGVGFSEAVILPLKTLLMEELQINSYGVIASASSFVNTVLPIIGGTLMDRWGGTRFLTVVGSLLAASSSVNNEYALLVAGEIFIGFGQAVSEVCQYKLYPHWFAGRKLALIFGLGMAWSRLVQTVAKVIAVPMADRGSTWGWPLWLGAILCLAGFGAVVAYALLERSIPAHQRPPVPPPRAGSFLQRTGLAGIARLGKFYWIWNVTQAFQHGVVTTYSANLTDILVKTRGTSQAVAGYASALQSVVPIVLTPLAGYLFDRAGHRAAWLSATAALYIAVFGLLGFTTVNALVPIIMSSFALCTNLLVSFASLPILVDGDELLGTAFGIFQSFVSGTLIMLVGAGAIQDATPHQSYTPVLALLMCFKAVDVCLGPVYHVLDRRWLAGSLALPEKPRMRVRQHFRAAGKIMPGLRVSRPVSLLSGAMLVGMVLTGWVLYIVYSLEG